jgi:hypothetical protein
MILHDVDYSTLPERMRGPVQRYIDHGYPFGGFLTAVFCNDFAGAFAKADITNRQALGTLAAFLWNEAPPECWGSWDEFEAWVNKGGQRGRG